MKAVRELGSDRRETGRSLSTVGGMCKHRKVFSLPVLTDERLTIGILLSNKTPSVSYSQVAQRGDAITNPT